MSLELQDFVKAIKKLGIEDSEVCIHSSMKSFRTEVSCGIDGIIEAFLSQKCTIMVPTFSDMYEARPVSEYMPKQNGAGDYSYFLERTYDDIEPFDTASKEISVEDMGKFSRNVLMNSKSIRGNNPLNSFTALGVNAEKLIKLQTNLDVYAPLRQLCEDDGYVLLMGVDLSAATIIHYAEQVAGRNSFVRWGYDKERKIIPVSAGGCSEGFVHFEEALSKYMRKEKVAESMWTCYKATDIVAVCSTLIKNNPFITHCGNEYCDRCNDAILGGPILNY